MGIGIVMHFIGSAPMVAAFITGYLVCLVIGANVRVMFDSRKRSGLQEADRRIASLEADNALLRRLLDLDEEDDG